MKDWSNYQKAIYNRQRTTSDNLLVQAVAGSGKTTTLEQCASLELGNSVMALAYNVHIADALKVRLPTHVVSRTMHSYCLNLLRSSSMFPPRVSEDKLYNLVKSKRPSFLKSFGIIKSLISLAKALGHRDGLFDISILGANFGIEIPEDYQALQEVVSEIFNLSVKDTTTIDFDDMIYNVYVRPDLIRKVGLILVDELQDFNSTKLAILQRAKELGSRIIGFGDVNQAIYGFQGADAQAMQKALLCFDAVEMPLSICYRCSKAVVEHAQEIVPQIEAAPNAREGKVVDVKSYLGVVRAGDMVLCRVNAPLVSGCLELIRMGVQAYVRGREFGKNLIALIDQLVHEDAKIDDLESALREYREIQTKRLANKDRQLEAMEDKLDTIDVFIHSAQSIREMKSQIERLFREDSTGICFSSIHRAKGLEAETVFCIRPDLLPHPRSKLDWAIQQERNLSYVMRTRAQDTLNYVRK